MNNDKPLRSWQEIAADPEMKPGVIRYAKDQVAAQEASKLRRSHSTAAPVDQRGVAKAPAGDN